MMCPMCNGDGVVLGALGKLTWERCRQCGMTFSGDRDDDVNTDDHVGDTDDYFEDDGFVSDEEWEDYDDDTELPE
jgi:hypothetical protein